jgi:hypothetical protein
MLHGETEGRRKEETSERKKGTGKKQGKGKGKKKKERRKTGEVNRDTLTPRPLPINLEKCCYTNKQFSAISFNDPDQTVLRIRFCWILPSSAVSER